MNRRELLKNEIGREALPSGVTDVKLLSEIAEGSPFANRGYKPDNWKAYAEFRINHSMPVVAGPLVSGNYTTYHPAVLGRSYESMLHQQMNLNHRVKSYAPQEIARDRIVGAIVAVHYPQGVRTVPKSKEDAIPITALCAIFKAAEGVPKMLGDHLSSRQEWSVSSECAFAISQIGLYLPSDGSLTPIMDATEEMWKGISRHPKTGGLRVGKVGGKDKGEQMIIAPGCEDSAIEYQGVGFTPNPAEREAVIDSVQAERLPDGLMAITAEAVPLAMFPRGVRWMDATATMQWARVLQVHGEGVVKLDRYRMEAKEGNPILHVRMRSGLELLRSLRSVIV